MQHFNRFLVLAWVFCLIGLCSCVSDSGSYQDSAVYPKALYGEVMRRSFEYEGPGRNPVIVIHGFLGARLVEERTERTIWGAFVFGDMLRAANYAELAHPMQLGKPLDEISGPVRPAGVLERSAVEVMGFRFNIDNYDILVNSLAGAGFVPDNRPLPEGKHFYSQFVFAYDWRRDISENAAELGKFIAEKRRYLQEKYAELYGVEQYDVQFDLIGHSMGGLLARYFLRYGAQQMPDDFSTPFPITWAGAKVVDKVIVIGTPNAGYVDTLIEMTEGLRLVKGAPAYAPSLIGSFASIYEMLPDPGHKYVVWEDDGTEVDYLNPETWIALGWGLANPAEDDYLALMLPEVVSAEQRRAIALDHLHKCLDRARQFKYYMSRPGKPPQDVGVYLIAGDAVETNHTLGVSRSGKLKVLRKDAGDGKVTAASARLDLRDGGTWLPFVVSPVDWTGVYYLQGGHMGIMNSDAFASNIRYILLAWPTQEQRDRSNEFLELLRRSGETRR